MAVSLESKTIAKWALQAFGGKPQVSKYWDEANKSHVDILNVADRPWDGITSCATIGLSAYSIGYTVSGKQLRVELAGACSSKYKDYPNMLATCAFHVINSGDSLSHGEVFRNIVPMYYPDVEMKHVLFVSPFLWKGLTDLDFPDKTVTWLLPAPLSESEHVFAQEQGTGALEDLWEQRNVDLLDLERKSVV
ncbi:suppressor of fused domain protein [Gorillibacterium sp. CAU 1737]|uniref:suppressor of fused domain protein n=1 Tax=Gorillibacterium sp. CAU 1737 TaxID=3140362 RepID=UPI0032606570